ncbi:DUF2905 domain-containing protein [Sporomusa termitida]|uniref:DUF2905 domain-containing protein n=1 Tax=Sporomusa termitida TaxID=2377 RepID=A0A517DU44_9FIRM|nr:DUF2905 domain-containing protein [Sporomusa termitida]QDR80861.1 hypothetical protein SPTER_21970 [Sporomusa termitida]
MPGGFDSFGKLLMVTGAVLLVAGLVFHFGGKFLSLGRLPGDIHIERGNFSFHFPLVTSILLSIIVTIILNLITRK